MEVKVKIVNTSKNLLPAYATAGAAGIDICAHLEHPVVLHSLERAVIPTGIFLEIPEGYEVQVRPRSGLAAKHGITVLNAPGTIDSDYRGEVGVILVNISKDDYWINNGDRIAQLVLCKVERASFEPVQVLGETQRGAGGFGSTGV